MIILALAVPSRWKRLLNLAVGVVIAVRLLALGLLAGVLASVDAAEAHDRAKVATRVREGPPYQGLVCEHIELERVL